MPLPIHKILLVDDDPDDGFLMEKALLDVSPGLFLRYLENADGLTTVLAADHPDLVFMDINMPRRNGFELLAALKASPFRHIPVVMYSCSDQPVYVAQAYEFGAALYLRKPLSLPGLVSSLRTILGYDWSDPAAITARQLLGGHYVAFGSTETR